MPHLGPILPVEVKVIPHFIECYQPSNSHLLLGKGNVVNVADVTISLSPVIRRRARLTQQEQVHKLEKGRRTIAAWEGGDYLPKAKGMVLQIAGVLGLSDEETTTLLKTAGMDPSPRIWNVPYPGNPYFTGRYFAIQSPLQCVRSRFALRKSKGTKSIHIWNSSLSGMKKLPFQIFATQPSKNARNSHQPE